jgi:Sulfotransferase family
VLTSLPTIALAMSLASQRIGEGLEKKCAKSLLGKAHDLFGRVMDMTTPLNANALIEEAHRATGIDAFDAETYREGLDVFVEDFNDGIAKGLYVESGIARARSDSLHYLKNRLNVADYLRQRPELLERPIERPVFVMGMARTGTTLMSNLLAADPARRSPLSWEIDDPIPPATTATLKTDPRALVRLDRERAMLAANPEAGKFYRGSAIYPNECVFFMAHDFKTLMIESKGILPKYREFIFSCDMTSSYQYHKKFLQAIQAEAPGIWNLKKPSHSLFLEYLFRIYPDARVIWMHRDPFTATGSLASLIQLSHRMMMGRIDHQWLGENYSWQQVQHCNRVMDFRDKFGEDKIVDVHYADVVRDPLGTTKALYARLGDAFTTEAEAAIQAWVDDNPQDKFGSHEYKLAQFGLSKESLAPQFERYLSRYDVEPEG